MEKYKSTLDQKKQYHIIGLLLQLEQGATLRVARYSVEEESGEPLLQEDRGPCEEVVDGLALLLASVPCQR